MTLSIVYRIMSLMVSFLPVRFRAKLWTYLMHVGVRQWPRESAAQRIPGGMYVKASSLIRLSEGQVLRYVGAHTSLPVPVVVDNFTFGRNTFLVMSRLTGQPLSEVYVDITPEVEGLLSAQLSRILAPLRALPPPSDAVCGWDNGPVHCERVAFGSPPVGPWESVAAFHHELMARTRRLVVPEEKTEVVHDVVQRAHSRTHRVCLTRNDLGPHNVLVDASWKITGIIDWEACAWMPEYWELTKGTFLPQCRKGRWNRIMTAVFPMYALELEAERYIVNYRECYA
ncbi:kinase-like protein [Sparassis crispa]|uniref:Kinase-like protein n=1 Tax=Sparassis crispa TaxID=139825 RepID=A0A401GP24_9APHY|nr:kinase-like protein [Sparassis crispa]GBE83975.1 kinase-like protein [Sparassis crispa]